MNLNRKMTTYQEGGAVAQVQSADISVCSAGNGEHQYMTQHLTLYVRVVRITEEYLGPAGERFMRRQIEEHLKIEPEDLEQKNLSKLIKWSSIAFALLTKNQQDIDAFTNDLQALTRNRWQ
jgi:hypothetical protein